MQVSLQWLRELVACDLAADVLAEKLSIAGFEVEEIVDLAARAAGVVVGYVEQRDPHPDANKLSVCTVAVGADAPLQIVCGAKNVRAGIHVAVATVGAYLPAVDLKIKPAELRGVASSGMICSLSELGLSDSSTASSSSMKRLRACRRWGVLLAPCLASTIRFWNWRSRRIVPTASPCRASPVKWRP